MDLTDLGTWWPLLLFTFSIYVFAFAVRKVIETVFPKAKANRWWVEGLLPLIPVLLGILTAIIVKGFPFPLADPSLGMRVLLGATGGFVSSASYRVVRSLVKAKTGVDIEAVTTTVSTTLTTMKSTEIVPPLPPPAV